MSETVGRTLMIYFYFIIVGHCHYLQHLSRVSHVMLLIIWVHCPRTSFKQLQVILIQIHSQCSLVWVLHNRCSLFLSEINLFFQMSSHLYPQNTVNVLKTSLYMAHVILGYFCVWEVCGGVYVCVCVFSLQFTISHTKLA